MPKNKKEKKPVDVELTNIILKIPVNAIKLKIKATILDDDRNEIKLSNILTKEDIDICREYFIENVPYGDDYDSIFVVTEDGRKILDDLESGKIDKDEFLRELEKSDDTDV